MLYFDIINFMNIHHKNNININLTRIKHSTNYPNLNFLTKESYLAIINFVTFPE